MGMSNVMDTRPSLLEKAVFFIGGFPGKVTVAETNRKAAGVPSTKVADPYWKKKKKFCYLKEILCLKKMPTNKKQL